MTYLDECLQILQNLEELSTSVFKDYIFKISLEHMSQRYKDIIGIVGEILFVRAKIDNSLLEDLRKYWKNNKIDYRCILEIKGWIESMVANEHNYNVYCIKNEIKTKFNKSLKDYAVKEMMRLADDED